MRWRDCDLPLRDAGGGDSLLLPDGMIVGGCCKRLAGMMHNRLTHDDTSQANFPCACCLMLSLHRSVRTGSYEMIVVMAKRIIKLMVNLEFMVMY